jgi:hypothetical protein
LKITAWMGNIDPDNEGFYWSQEGWNYHFL